MPEAGKVPLIDIRVRARGKKKAEELMALLRQHGAEAEVIEDDDDELLDFFQTDLYKEARAAMTPGKQLRLRRENAGLTQVALGEKAGMPATHISDMENGRRPIGEAVAGRLAAALGLPAGILQRPW